MRKLLILLALCAPMWGAFGYKRTVTVDYTKVPTATKTDFTILVSVTDNGLRTVANGGHVTSATGYDIYFYSDEALTTRIPAEREAYTATTGALIAWVKVASLSHTADTVVYMAYGDSGISTDPNADATYGAEAAWDSNTHGTWHLPDGSTLAALDSTSNNNDGTISGPTAATGKIGGAATFDGGTSRRIDAGTSSTLDAATQFSLSAWINWTATGNIYIVGKNQSTTRPYNYQIQWASSVLYCSMATSTTDYDLNYSFIPTTGVWYHVVCNYDGANHRLYVDGTQRATAARATLTLATGTSRTFLMGGRAGGTTSFNGLLDEVKIATVGRTADWITTEYNNQSDPGAFLALGTETPISGATRRRVVIMQ